MNKLQQQLISSDCQEFSRGCIGTKASNNIYKDKVSTMYQYCTTGAGPERTTLERVTSNFTASGPGSFEYEAYTAQYRLEQMYSRQRRDCLFRLSALAFVSFFGLFVVTCYYDAPANVLQQTHRSTERSSLCGTNLTVEDLIQEIESLPETHDTTNCRQGAPMCDWQNPTLPKKRQSDTGNTAGGLDQWDQVHESHVEKIQASVEAQQQIDVVFMGDTMVEHMEGTELGVPIADLKYHKKAFDILFHKNHGGRISGMTLGITDDRCSNLLYRIENGEMPEVFKPKVWWLVIGTRDLQLGLNDDAIIAGILKIAETIHLVHEEAHIVINSILPQGQEALGPDNPSYSFVSKINDRLHCYVEASHHYPRISFFNATDVFIKGDDKEEGNTYVNEVMMPDFVNPGFNGVVKWGHHVVERVLELTNNPTEE